MADETQTDSTNSNLPSGEAALSVWVNADLGLKNQFINSLSGRERELMSGNFDLSNLSQSELLDTYKTIYSSSNPMFKGIWETLLSNQGKMTESPMYDAYKNARQILGRDVDANELNNLLPYFEGANGIATGRQYLTQLAQYEKDKKETEEKVGGYGDTVRNAVQSLMDRGATESEIDYFSKKLASGEISPYEMEQFLQGTQEYQNLADKRFQDQLSQQTQSYDLGLINKGKEAILSDFAQRLGPNLSSSMDDAITRMMGDIAKERSNWLASVTAANYGGNKNIAQQNYQNTLDESLRNKWYSKERQDQLKDSLLNRSWNNLDYSTQRKDYLSYLMRQMGGGGGSANSFNRTLNRVSVLSNPIQNFALMGGKDGFGWWG